MSTSRGIRVVLGTMRMGASVDEAASRTMVELCASTLPRVDIDTAIMYCDGMSERILGVVTPRDAYVATKVNPWWRDGVVTTEPRGGLGRAAIRAQLTTSLASLQRESVDLLYLHAPDKQTPLDETLAEVNALHREGRFREFGLSNYAAWEVAAIHAICLRNGYVLPTVYQGMYNLLTRAVEPELLVCCRAHGLRFLAYNPLAGGMLTGRHSAADDPTDGRFASTTFWGQAYRKRYWNEKVFTALGLLGEACAAAGVTLTAAALRWLVHHSALGAGDGVIVGASSVSQLEENLAALAAGPLPDAIVAAADNAAELARSVCPPYFR